MLQLPYSSNNESTLLCKKECLVFLPENDGSSRAEVGVSRSVKMLEVVAAFPAQLSLSLATFSSLYLHSRWSRDAFLGTVSNDYHFFPEQ